MGGTREPGRVPSFAKEVLDSDRPVYVRGADRLATNVTGYAIAALWKRRLTWVDIRDMTAPSEPYDSVLKNPTRANHDYLPIVPTDLLPETELSKLAASSMNLSETPGGGGASMLDFLRLPRLAQQLIGDATEGGPGRTVLTTNADRIDAIYRDRLEDTRALINAIHREGVKLVMTSTGTLRADRFAFDFVFVVDSNPGQRWEDSTVRIEHGTVPPDSVGAQPTPLTQADCIARLLSGRPNRAETDGS